MRAVVVYESMYGNTHMIASAIGAGLRDRFEVDVVPVAHADAAMVEGADLIVAGGPTHAHSISRENTRHQAIEDAHKPDRDLEVDPDAEGPGLRDWLPTIATGPTHFAAFDTRVDIAVLLSGRAAKAISKRLRHQGMAEAIAPESFLVTTQNVLEPGEPERARAWGQQIAAVLVPTA